MTRISFQEMHRELRRILLKIGFTDERAELCSKVFAENTLDGTASHGINRFPAVCSPAHPVVCVL